LWLAIAVTTGVGFLAYLAAWIIMPSDYGQAPQTAFVPGPLTS
jgi:phage shock protein PspC (stress-responsive transcriptional regulator)